MRVAAFVLWAVLLLVALVPVLRGRALPTPPRRPLPTDELVKDPVCQTYIVRSRAVSRQTTGGPRYFCSADCASRFVG